MKNFLTNYKEVLILGVITFALSFGGLWATGGITDTIYPETANDDTYYLARVNTVHNGYFNIGSPYYFEHRLDKAPAFTLPDIISSIPLFLGLSMNKTIVFNFIFWSEVFCLLMWIILLKFNFSKKYAVVGTLFIYLQVYWMIMRPVSLQVIWPILLLFILGVIVFENGVRDRLGLGLIMASTALSFYYYSYLSQLLVVILFLMTFYYFYQGARKKFLKVLSVGVIVLLLIIPELIHQYKHFLDPIYWQTLDRLGMVKSHFPSIFQYNYGRWVLLAMPTWYLLRRKINENNSLDFFVYIFGFGLVFVNWSSLLTGTDLYLGTHIGIFITLYIAIVGVLITHHIINNFSGVKKEKLWINLIICFMLLGLAANLTSNFQRSLPYREVWKSDLIKYENFFGVINWINSLKEVNKIILSDDGLAIYIPIYTNFYSVFALSGQLGMMGTEESIDRYITSRAIQKKITKDQFVNERAFHSGLGDGARLDNVNIKNKWCRNYRLDVFFGMFCSEDISMTDYKGDSYWKDLNNKWDFNKNNLQDKLSYYGTKYLIWPKDRMNEVDLSNLFIKVVYEDEYYVVYELIKK